MKVTNVTSAMPSPPPAGDDGPRLNLRGFTWEPVMSTGISKKYFRPGGMAPSELTRSVRAVRDTLVADYSAAVFNATRRIVYRPPIAVSPCLLALSVY
jgi:hypothetical protein